MGKFAQEHILWAQFELWPLENIREFPALIKKRPDLRGLSVTIPYKEKIIEYLDELDPVAAHTGAVNCIHIANGRLKGFNTDVTGFEHSLAQHADKLKKARSACILGTGGAAKAVAYVLRKLDIPYVFVSRKSGAPQSCTYEDLAGLQPDLLVNCTPVGMFPRTAEMPPVPPGIFHANQLVYDLIYNPSETLLLREARHRGSTVQNGMEMLRLQAEAAWEIWIT